MAVVKPKAVLVGPPASGKTTIGRRLGNALHLPVVDSDDLIAQKYGKACGDVLRSLGEPEFRKVEEEAVAEALQTSGIVSLGGGAVISSRTRELLRDHNVVFLHVTAEEGVRRASDNNSRPLLDVEDPTKKYRELLEQRGDFYEEVASLRVRSGNSDPQRVVTAILQFIEDNETEHRRSTHP